MLLVTCHEDISYSILLLLCQTRTLFYLKTLFSTLSLFPFKGAFLFLFSLLQNWLILQTWFFLLFTQHPTFIFKSIEYSSAVCINVSFSFCYLFFFVKSMWSINTASQCRVWSGVQTDTVDAWPWRADGPQSHEEHHPHLEGTALHERATRLHQHSAQAADHQVSTTV